VDGTQRDDDTGESQRLVALPRRVGGDTDELIDLLATSPAASITDLLDRTNHLLGQLELDIASLREDQARDRQRIEQEAEERQAIADSAIKLVKLLEREARNIAERKRQVDVLEQALARPAELDMTVSYEETVDRIEVELRLAKGITGALRLGTIADLLKQAELRVEYLVRRADASRRRLIEQTEVELKAEGKEARASYEIGMSVVRRDLKALDLALPPSGLAWEDGRWGHWEDWDPLSGVSRWIRYGTFFRPQLERFRFPSLLELPGGRGLAIDVATGDRAVAVDAARSIILRLLASAPAGDVRFTFVDPTGLGESVAPFLALGEYRSDLIDENVYTLEHQIEEKLVEINRHIETVIQQHLRAEHATLEACNEAMGETVEPYRFLVVFDFPQALTDRARELLRTIIETGPRCGVYTILVTKPGAARAHGARWRSMLAGLERVVGDKDGFWVDTEDAGRWAIELERPPELVPFDEHGEPTLFGRILTTTGEEAQRGRDKDVTLGRIFEQAVEAARVGARDDLADVSNEIDVDEPSTWWTGDASRGVGVPIGRSGGRDVASLWLDSQLRSGAVVVGEPGSGVSTVLHDIVLGLSITYSPDELLLYLVDFEPGDPSGFGTYATEALPHARVVAVDAEREFGVSLLDSLTREMTRRSMLFAPYGGERAGFEHYRRQSDDVLPRIVVVIDRVDHLVAASDRVTDQAAQLLDVLVRQGPAYGIHFVVSASSFVPLASVGRRTFDQLRVRVALAGTDEESRLVLGADDGIASTFTRSGDGVLALAGSEPGSGTRFQSVWVPEHERGVNLRDLRRKADAAGFERTPQIFESVAPARLEDSGILSQLGASARTQQSRRQPRLWLGEPVAMGGPVEVTLRREPGANLLLVGRDERLIHGMLTAALTSIVLGHGADLDVMILDFMPLETGLTEVARALGREHGRVRVARGHQLVEVLGRVRGEIERRSLARDYNAAPLLFVINGLGRASELDAFESRQSQRGDDEFDAVAVLEAILRDGPEVGASSVLCADSAVTLAQRITRATLRCCGLRVALQQPADESNLVVESTSASTLGPNQGLLYDEAAGRLTKFRPYALPTVDTMVKLARSMPRDLTVTDGPRPADGAGSPPVRPQTVGAGGSAGSGPGDQRPTAPIA
jgi:DNA segregation ATPase FtsK/SpoIIIE, S-DNA-T family